MSTPVVIEAAISPLRRGAPAQSVDAIVDEADACIRAGAGIIHHHHDMRLAAPDAIDALADTARRIQRAHPGTLVYSDYLKGHSSEEENAHLDPMAREGILTMFAIDPGITSFASVGNDGLPTRTYTDGLQFLECHRLVDFAKEAGIPISLGVFEPGHLRWILAYEQAAGFSPASMVKLYFGGSRLVDQVDTPGINFGLPGTPAALDLYLSMMAGSALPWTVSLFGDAILDTPLARHALECGGHVRVGVEDAAGMSPLSNAEMVRAAAELAESCGRTPVAGDAARRALAGELLGLP